MYFCICQKIPANEIKVLFINNEVDICLLKDTYDCYRCCRCLNIDWINKVLENDDNDKFRNNTS